MGGRGARRRHRLRPGGQRVGRRPRADQPQRGRGRQERPGLSPPARRTSRGTKVVGFGFDRDHLELAGITKAEAFASVTSGDNSNILCARIARETYGIEHVVARIYDPRRALIYQRLGIPTVATVAWTTDQVLRRLLPAETSAATGSTPPASVGIIERPIPAKAVGKKLRCSTEPGRFWLTAVTRFGQGADRHHRPGRPGR